MKAKLNLVEFFNERIGKGREFSTKKDMARFLGLPDTQASKLYSFLKGSDTQYMSVLEWFEKLGGSLLPPETEPSREVCFVNARMARQAADLPPPGAEDYIAVPLVGEVGAGCGRVPEDEVRSWVLVWRHQSSVRHKDNLIAVEIDRNSDSMAPTLRPGDIVLIDCDSKDISENGKIWLVKDEHGEGKIKRVYVEHLKDKRDYKITFASDNKSWPPEVFFLGRHFDNEWSNVLVGRAVWSWSDIKDK